MIIGNVVREIRARRGMSKVELAKASGLSRMSIFRIETGRQDPTLGTVERLAKALEVSILTLVRKALEDRGGKGRKMRGRGKLRRNRG